MNAAGGSGSLARFLLGVLACAALHLALDIIPVVSEVIAGLVARVIANESAKRGFLAGLLGGTLGDLALMALALLLAAVLAPHPPWILNIAGILAAVYVLKGALLSALGGAAGAMLLRSVGR